MSAQYIGGFLNVAGLLLDIVGVILLFVFGLSINFNWRGIPAAHPYKVPHHKAAIIGLSCVIFGFFIQVAGNLTLMINV